MNKLKNSIILVGGGTGGHAVPVLEIFRKLKKDQPDVSVKIVGSGSAVEKKIFAEVFSDYIIVESGKWHRHEKWRNIKEVYFLLKGLLQSLVVFYRYKPKVLFSKGGYVALNMVYMARLFKVPYYIHESDIEMGLVNKVTAKSAKKIFISFPPKYYSSLPVDKTEYSGPIIRQAILETNRGDHSLFGFAEKKPIILVTGGSQGSLIINRCLAKAAKNLILKYNLIHQAGHFDYGWVNEFRSTLSAEEQQSYFVTDYLGPMEGNDLMLAALEQADLVVSRAGANTLSELAIKGKPMILIPYRYAAADHQLKNARMLEEMGAALVISEDDFSPQLLIDKIESLFADDSSGLKVLFRNTKNVFAEDGLKIVCQNLIEEVNKV